ncbi:MAG TPA: hypothetical protein VI757_01440 [Bacteroidia bacterium]|nr:hypothetical protein [Bacteroidia bacterium]
MMSEVGKHIMRFLTSFGMTGAIERDKYGIGLKPDSVVPSPSAFVIPNETK